MVEPDRIISIRYPRATTGETSTPISNRRKWPSFYVFVILLGLSSTLGIIPNVVFASDHASLRPRHIVLFYDDYPTRGDPDFQVAMKIVKPLVAYIDRDGKPRGWMFDSFIFYSRYLYYKSNPTQAYVNSWISYIFDGGQVRNLDLAVGELKVTLGVSSYQLGVFIAVPVALGQVDTEHIRRNVDKIMKNWNDLSPANLRLLGFYWGFTEDLNSIAEDRLVVDDTDRAVLSATADYVHSKGLRLLMIPYRSAAGKDEFHKLGVDYVTVQPNYMNDPLGDLNRFAKVNTYINLGFADGPEQELPLSVKCCNKNWVSNIQTYKDQSMNYGWNRLINTYYHGSDISSMGRSTEGTYRAAYEAIYQYIVSA